ncbi:cation/H(+) antiporter 15-like [Canna indica]|uniref:Cation/H(+) antiporter 15-like n=1 Tax=Canna indica TaxID=4628 RepID=A0AAQ3KKY2_9LILI|nr:cation/H(+) antiporter 15-like [Canna indica]
MSYPKSAVVYPYGSNDFDEPCVYPSQPFSNGVFYHEEPLKFYVPLLLFQIVVVVFFSRTLYFILRPLKQPRQICDMIAGITLGPTTPYIYYQIRLLFHQWAGDDISNAPDFARIKKNYLDVFFAGEGFSLMMSITTYASVIHFFLVCTRVNTSYIMQFGKKSIAIAICVTCIPQLVLSRVIQLFEIQGPEGTRELQGIGPSFISTYIVFVLGMISLPVVGEIVSELRLINTELGRLTMCITLMCDLALSVYTTISITAQNSVHLGAFDMFKKVIGIVIFVLFLFFLYRPLVRWIVRRTPKGGRVSEEHILLIIIILFVMTIYSEACLTSSIDAAIYMGLLIPDGPPLGTALIERLQLIHSDIFLPLVFLVWGRWLDVTRVENPRIVFFLTLFVLLAYVLKLICVMVPAVYFNNMPIRNAAFIGLLVSSCGLVQFSVLGALKSEAADDEGMMKQEAYLSLVIGGIFITGLASFLVSYFYDPLDSSHLVGCRTVQHLRPHTEFRMVVSVINEDPVPLLVNFIEAACANEYTPTCAYVLHLVELKGQLTSTITAHKTKKGQINPRNMDRLHNVFINLEETKKSVLVVQPFTATAPYKSMHNDVCSLAMEKNVHFIVLPFPRKGYAMNSDVNQAARSIVPPILAQAPCSVGIFIHHTLTSFAPAEPGLRYHVRVLFWGGKDDREALACAGRMAQNFGVLVKVTRFILAGSEQDEMELSRDMDVIEEFKIYNTGNDRVAFEEMMMDDFEATINFIRSIEEDCDLIIVGKQQDSRLLVCEGMEDWSESPELGVVGDILASSDFADSSFSILVVQQYA